MAGADDCDVNSSESGVRVSLRGSCSLSLPALLSAAAAPGGPGTSSECRRLRSASLAWPRRRSRPGMIGISRGVERGTKRIIGSWQATSLFFRFSGRL